MKPLTALLPLGPAHGTHERAFRHPLAVRQEDLRAATFDVGLMPVDRREIRKGRLRSDACAALECATVAAAVRIGSALGPLRRALRTPERALGLVEAAPLD